MCVISFHQSSQADPFFPLQLADFFCSLAYAQSERRALLFCFHVDHVRDHSWQPALLDVPHRQGRQEADFAQEMTHWIGGGWLAGLHFSARFQSVLGNQQGF
jgi:hypothetical protein